MLVWCPVFKQICITAEQGGLDGPKLCVTYYSSQHLCLGLCGWGARGVLTRGWGTGHASPVGGARPRGLLGSRGPPGFTNSMVGGAGADCGLAVGPDCPAVPVNNKDLASGGLTPPAMPAPLVTLLFLLCGLGLLGSLSRGMLRLLPGLWALFLQSQGLLLLHLCPFQILQRLACQGALQS